MSGASPVKALISATIAVQQGLVLICLNTAGTIPAFKHAIDLVNGVHTFCTSESGKLKMYDLYDDQWLSSSSLVSFLPALVLFFDFPSPKSGNRYGAATKHVGSTTIADITSETKVLAFTDPMQPNQDFGSIDRNSSGTTELIALNVGFVWSTTVEQALVLEFVWAFVTANAVIASENMVFIVATRSEIEE
ncbi:hypothetical protein H310_05078 [Aphanomyces invadans]|uniref:Uncharacterized protein n=1 Tax=Aphanomyces invadans TaxID=157072 RepID=A0A024UCS2_9STRA|nr:hypothetical protein H310_05078 [Aphanomyces invadans]ETW03692.1 hypothetical protein H310_05078 [Aphanomyces invadans]|eukprot:XP_008867921.1 hypothetical protein H310_05078 [Aphanomyces invadans]